MKQYKRRYKRIANTAVAAAAVVTIGSSMMFAPAPAAAASGPQTKHHASAQRKAPAWREGLKTAEAKALGLSLADYKQARRSKSLDQLIAAKGLTPQQFTNRLTTELTAHWKSRGVGEKEITSRLAKLAKYQQRREGRWEK